jgi:hypothetical protein
MRTEGRSQLHGQALALGLVDLVGLGQELLSPLPQGVDRLAKGQELPFGVAHQGHEDTALSPALAAKTTHDLFDLLLQAVGLGPQLGGLAAASSGEAVDEFKGCFGALYSVVASVTRWLPCSAGKVSTTR